MMGVTCANAFTWASPLADAPPISITNAYRLATEAVGSATNLFHCTRTNGNLSFLNEGEWLFVFTNTNRHYKAVYLLRKFAREPEDTNEVRTVVFDDPQDESVAELRHYKLQTNAFYSNLRFQEPTVSETNLVLLRTFFLQNGVDLAYPNSVFLNDRTGELLVRAKPEIQNQIAPLVEQLNVPK